MAPTLIKKSVPYVVVLVILYLVFLFLHGANLNWHAPLVYDTDGLFSLAYVKTIIDAGWPLTNPYLAAPGLFQLYDYPSLDNFSFLIQKIIAFWTHNPFVLTNVFFILTFIMSAYSGLWVCCRLGLSRIFAVVVAVLFAILPYHFWRNEGHLYLSAYFAVPLWLLLAFSILDKRVLPRFKKWYWNAIGLFILLCIIVNSGVYYTFFGLFYVFIAGLIARLSKQGWQPMKRSLIIILMSGAVAIISLAPNLIFSHQHGKNRDVAHRGFSSSEVFGLQLTQLLLPAQGHRLANFEHVHQRYTQETEQVLPLLINENVSSALGLLGALGFLASLGIIFGVRARQAVSHLHNAALFNFAGLLLGTIGGLGTLFAMFISPEIRSYNRISVFLGFLSLLVLFKLIQYCCERYQFKSWKIGLIAVLLLSWGIFDQTPTYASFQKLQVNQPHFKNDQIFVKRIEQAVPKNSYIFQLPYQAFPEVPPLYKMTDYAQFRPYLNSQSLHWSYGAMRGRAEAKWQQHVSQLPIAKMLKVLRKNNFNGIYINLNGYRDHGTAIEKKLEALLHEKPLKSPNANLSFFVLRKVH